MSETVGLENPILNSPYEAPEAHFVLGPNGPTGEVKPGRRPSESFIPVPPSRKKPGRKRIDPPNSNRIPSTYSTPPVSVVSRTA